MEGYEFYNYSVDIGNLEYLLNFFNIFNRYKFFIIKVFNFIIIYFLLWYSLIIIFTSVSLYQAMELPSEFHSLNEKNLQKEEAKIF